MGNVERGAKKNTEVFTNKYYQNYLPFSKTAVTGPSDLNNTYFKECLI